MSARTLPASLAGRCANGYERGAGTVVHAVPSTDHNPNDIAYYARSLCNKTHGARSAGWSPRFGAGITCARCLRKLPAQDLRVVDCFVVYDPCCATAGASIVAAGWRVREEAEQWLRESTARNEEAYAGCIVIPNADLPLYGEQPAMTTINSDPAP